MPAIAREGDPFTTGHPCDSSSVLDKPGTSVMANNKPVAIVGTPSVTHSIKRGKSCVPHTVPVTSGSSTVFVDGKPAAFVTSSIDNGSISDGSGNVFCG